MPNAIKYNTSAETLALKKGNFWIGTGDVGKGPTSSTGYYNGITPPSGGYTIYLNKETGGPSIYTVTTEAQMVSLTNTIGAQSFTTSGQCLNWFATQTDKMIFNIDYPAIVTNGLVLNLDAGFTPSYPTTGTTWYDISNKSNNSTIFNGATYSNGSIVFDGTDDYVTVPATDFQPVTSFTINVVFKLTEFIPSDWVGIFNKGDNGWRIQLSKVNSTTFTINGAINFYLDQGFRDVETGVFNVNDICFVTLVYNKNGDLTIFCNGTKYQSVTSNVDVETNNYLVGIGYNTQIANRLFKGNMYYVSFSTKSLTDAEVLQNYNAMKGRFGL
jgi:hypothetical protein